MEIVDIVGAIIGPVDRHYPDRNIRFGVICAPEPSERVKRILDADPAVWQPAVNEIIRESSS